MHTIYRRESLVSAAKQAGIAVPDDLSVDAGYPHWRLFCMVQLDRPIDTDIALQYNAAIVAAIASNRVSSIQFEDISDLLM